MLAVAEKCVGSRIQIVQEDVKLLRAPYLYTRPRLLETYIV